MLSLKGRGVIKSMEFNSFTRIHHEDTEIKVLLLIERFLIESDRILFGAMIHGFSVVVCFRYYNI